MTTTQALIGTLIGAFLVLVFLVALIDTVQKARLDYRAKKDRLRLAAIAERNRQDFVSDHPDRERIGMPKEER